jgi:hypothetical protein
MAIGLSGLVGGAFWMWSRTVGSAPELQKNHLALILPVDLDGGDVPDLVMVYARSSATGVSLVEAVRGEDQAVLWSSEVPGMAVSESQGVRPGAVGRGLVALLSRRPTGDQMTGLLTVLDSRSGATLWDDTDLPVACDGFWTDVEIQTDVVVAFCRGSKGHAIRIYHALSGEIRWQHEGAGEIVDVSPVFLSGMLVLPDPVHGRWVYLDGRSEGLLAVPGQVYVDQEEVVATRRDESCSSNFRLERLNRLGLSEPVPLTSDAGCLPEGLSPFRPLGWGPDLLAGVTADGGLIGVSGGQPWRLQFSEGYRHRALYYEYKRGASELSALHDLPGSYHPFIIRKTDSRGEFTRLAVVDLRTGELHWQSQPLLASTPWLSRHVIRVGDRFLILVPDGERTRLLILDPETGLFVSAVEVIPDDETVTSAALMHHNLELHLYPERLVDGWLYGSMRDGVFSIDLDDWTVRSYRGASVRVDQAWRALEGQLGELPQSL